MKGKYALVTGATSGIGQAVAIELASLGCHLIICGRREGRLREFKKQLESDFEVEVTTLSFDIQSKTEIETVFSRKKAEIAKVSILINNAGLAKNSDSVLEADTDDWDQMIDTNIKGLLYVSRLLLPAIKKHIHADIVNIGSVAGRWTYPGGAVYCATKHAVRAISEGMRQDLCGTNVRVCCIEPGMVETEFSTVRFGDEKKAKDVYVDMDPLSAKDIADCVVWNLARPRHVSIQEMVIYPTAQASVTQVHRGKLI